MSFTIRKVSETPRKKTVAWGFLGLTLLKFARPLLSLYQDWREREKKRKEREFLKRIALVLIAILCALLLFAGVTKALVALRVLSVRNIISLGSAELPKDERGFTNILLLGQGDVTGEDLTDSIMVASIDPEHTKSIVLLSLPRDLYFLHTEKMDEGRINSLYRDHKISLKRKGLSAKEASMGAIEALASEVGLALGLPIHRVIKVDFEGFEQAVDEIGGVDITVPYDITDDKYPGPNYTYETFEIQAGPRHLDGKTALKYARSRSTTSDFDRSGRQQQILEAIADKVQKEGILHEPSRILSLMSTIAEHTETTLTSGEILSLANVGMDVPPERIISMHLSDRNGLYDEVLEPGGFLYTPPRDQFEGASVLLPISVPEFPVTWKQIRTLTNFLFQNRSVYLARSPIHVLNAGGPVGSARKLGNELIRYGFSVEKIQNASIPKQERSTVAALSESGGASAQFFASLLQLPVDKLPADLPADEAAPVTIIVGKDFHFTLLQSLTPPSR